MRLHKTQTLHKNGWQCNNNKDSGKTDEKLVEDDCQTGEPVMHGSSDQILSEHPSRQEIDKKQIKNAIPHNYSKAIIFNESRRVLSEDEERILSRGLKFVPTRRKVETSKLLADLREWERKMRIREFYFDKNDQESMMHMRGLGILWSPRFGRKKKPGAAIRYGCLPWVEIQP